jgi:hypothetical protein
MTKPKTEPTLDYVYTSLCCRLMRKRDNTLMRRDHDYTAYVELLSYQCKPGTGCRQWN